MHPVEITCAAKYLPEKIVTNAHLATFLDTSDEWISSRTGIKQRHISTNENTSDLGTKVCESLIEKSGIKAEEIGMIIVATISPDYLSPATACIIQKNIGACNAFAFDINAACTGFVYALSIAEKYVSSGVCNHAIVIGAEVMSKEMDWSDRSECVLFGDGAGGIILSQSKNKQSSFIAESLRSDGNRYSCIISGERPVQNAFTEKKRMKNTYLKMKGREVFDFATRNVPENISRLLEQASISSDDVKYIIPHQANSRIVEIIAKKMNISIEKFYMNINEYGNTTAATIPIALAEMIEKGLLKYGNGDKVILTGFGSGVTWGSILIKI